MYGAVFDGIVTFERAHRSHFGNGRLVRKSDRECYLSSYPGTLNDRGLGDGQSDYGLLPCVSYGYLDHAPPVGSSHYLIIIDADILCIVGRTDVVLWDQ